MDNTSKPCECLSIEEAGRRLGISRGLAYRLARQGELPTLRLGDRRLLIPVRALEKLLETARGEVQTRG